MKILMLTDRMDAGGAETHVAQLALGLQAQGHEVVLLSGGGRLAKMLEAEGIRQISVKLPTHNPFRLFRLWRLVQSLAKREGFAILHAHTRLTALLLRGCARHGSRSIVTVHARFSYNPLLSRICYWGHRTVAVSEDLRAYVCDVYRVPAERVSVIPNAIDCTRFSPIEREGPRQGCGILFASRLDRDCSLGAELLCSISPTLCALYQDLSIEIAGNGNAFETIRTLADKANTQIGRTAITLTGFVEDMPPLLRKKDIFIGVSRAALEACACGCAVILCGNEGYFGPLTAENIETAALTNFCARGLPVANSVRLETDLCNLLDSPTRCKQNADACATWVQAHRDAEQMCCATLALYQHALPTPYRKTLTVGGYFGCGNMGDDAILLGLLTFLSQTAPDLRILALTGSPRYDRKRFCVSCVSRRNPLAILHALLRSDALLFGGGSLLQDATSKRSLLYYLSLIRLARHLKRPILFCAAGIGPLIRESARVHVKTALNQCRYVSLRDQRSLHLLTSLGVDPAHLYLGADPALLLAPPVQERAEHLIREHGLSANAAYLGVVLRGGAMGMTARKLVIASVRMLCNRHGITPLFLILDRKHDVAVTKTAQRVLGGVILQTREIEDISAVFAVCRAVVSMRLHALILSAAVGCSGVGVLSDPRDAKIPGFAASVGMECISPEQLSVANLVEVIERTLTDPKHLTPILLDSVAEMRKKATKDLANIVEMIYNNSQ